MVYYLYRTHVLPIDINVRESVTYTYKTNIRTNGVAMTARDMDILIRSRWRRCDVWGEQTIELVLPDMESVMRTIESESLDQHYFDIKPSAVEYTVLGRSVHNHMECLICKDANGLKIELSECLCTFHRECIETSLKYSPCCPVCQSTINSTHDTDIDATTAEKTKTTPTETDELRQYDRVHAEETEV